MRNTSFKVFAWRGIILQIPQDWDMAVDSGLGEDSGYIRIDDLTRPRLEIKWERVPFEKAKNPEEIAEKYLKDLRKKLEKRAKSIAKARKLKKIKLPEIRVLNREETRVRDHEALLMHLRGPEEALFLTWYCEKTERYYTLQLSFKKEEYTTQRVILDKVIRTLACHTDEELQLWSVYGLTFYIPKEMSLTNRKFTTGFSYMTFSSKKRDKVIILAYSTMANILLEEYYRDLEDWFKALLLKRVINAICKLKAKKARELSLKGHEGILVKGSTSHIFKSKKLYLNGLIWHCPDSNRVISLSTILKGTDNEEYVIKLSEKVYCH